MKTCILIPLFAVLTTFCSAQNTTTSRYNNTTVDKNGIFRYDRKALDSLLGIVRRFAGDTLEAGIHDILQDSKGDIWISKGGCGTFHFLYRLNAKNTTYPCLNNSCRHDFKKASDLGKHNLAIEKLFAKIEMKDGHKEFEVTHIFEDKKGNLWFGTYYNGVLCFDGKQLIPFSVKDGLNTSYITIIVEDKKGNIWFGTGGRSEGGWQGNGAFSFDGKTIAHFTTKDGLAENWISNIYEDKDGKLLFSTNHDNWSRFDPDTNHALKFIGKL